MEPKYIIEIYASNDPSNPKKQEISRMPGEPIKVFCPYPDRFIEDFWNGAETYFSFNTQELAKKKEGE